MRMTRRHVLKQAGLAAAVTTTSPWWLVRTSHAQRAKKLVFWHVPNFTPLADDLQKQQVYEFAKQAGNPPDVMRLYESNVQFYAAGGHLLDVHDLVEKMRKEPKGIFES